VLDRLTHFLAHWDLAVWFAAAAYVLAAVLRRLRGFVLAAKARRTAQTLPRPQKPPEAILSQPEAGPEVQAGPQTSELAFFAALFPGPGV
jgi:hypothetical protein